jgi:Spy/CpxP family protein refolding chaperone
MQAKILLLFVCTWLSLTAATAQSVNLNAPDANSALGKFSLSQIHLTKKLRLTPRQLKQLDTVNDFYVVRNIEIQEDFKKNKTARKSALRDLKKEREVKFKAILTDEQRSQWTRRNQRRALRQARRTKD